MNDIDDAESFPPSTISNQPFKVPLRRKTLDRYLQTTTQFLTFTLRASSDLFHDRMNLMIAPSIIEDSNSLISALKSKNDGLIENAIHKLMMSTLNLPYKSKERFICPISRFIIYASVLPSGQIHDPGGVNGILTELKWPFRASTFWEMVQQCKELEENDENIEM